MRLFLFALMALLSAAPALAEQRIALVIGNSAYQGNAWRPLKNPANDARLMATTLTQLGFSVTTLIDADEDAMEDAIKDLGQSLGEAGDDAVGLFYYAGHGVQLNGFNYLIPIDTRARVEEDVTRSAIRLGRVEERMGNGGARLNFVILDACRSNGLATASRNQGGLARTDTSSERFFFAFSTAPGFTATDGTGANSPYAEALSQSLLTPGLQYEQAFKQAARLTGQRVAGQRPFYETGMTEDFCFRGCGPAGASAAARPQAGAAPASTPPPAAPRPTPVAAAPATPGLVLEQTLRGHEKRVYGVALSPDGTLAATASEDETARVWDVKTGKQVSQFAEHSAYVFYAEFSPDSTRIVSSGLSDMHVWTAAPASQWPSSMSTIAIVAFSCLMAHA